MKIYRYGIRTAYRLCLSIVSGDDADHNGRQTDTYNQLIIILFKYIMYVLDGVRCSALGSLESAQLVIQKTLGRTVL